MKTNNNFNDFVEIHNFKQMARRRSLFRAFWINTLFVVVVWLLTFIPDLIFLGVILTGVSAASFYMHALATLALWGLAGVVLFLVPALAIRRE